MKPLRLTTVLVAPVLMASAVLVGACGRSADSTTDGRPSGADTVSPSLVLPSLASFRTQPSDQFLVDFDAFEGGHPYKGLRAKTPHSGAHVHFATSSSTWPTDGSEPTMYPAIYAVADGVVSHIDTSMNVGTNDRYGVTLTIARDGDTDWNFDYSIEPMVPEPSSGFYSRFIAVAQGDAVRKGQVIAYMYAPPRTNGTHIHFELMNGMGGQFAAPAIFAPDVVAQFAAHWGEFGRDGNGGSGPQISTCMGWMLDAAENPFGDGPADCL